VGAGIPLHTGSRLIYLITSQLWGQVCTGAKGKPSPPASLPNRSVQLINSSLSMGCYCREFNCCWNCQETHTESWRV
jgi:hypothetical protein